MLTARAGNRYVARKSKLKTTSHSLFVFRSFVAKQWGRGGGVGDEKDMMLLLYEDHGREVHLI